MLWLLFGDAFGPAYAIFLCFCIQLCSFVGGGSNFKKCFTAVLLCVVYVCVRVCCFFCLFLFSF